MPSPRSSKQWLEILSDTYLATGMDGVTLDAVFFYLVDLGLFVDSGEGQWTIHGKTSVAEDYAGNLEERLRGLCQEPKGKPLAYLLLKGREWMPEPETSSSSTTKPSIEKGFPAKTSNLSNLQIVNKYGRQVQSFIELEQEFMRHLVGPQTDKKAARKLFNYILSQMKEKAAPRPWEQLSRRRHR